MKTKKVSIVICCFNEEQCIVQTIEAVHGIMVKSDYDFEIICVDDGSDDSTLNMLKNMAKPETNVFYIELSRNFGKDNAMLAGMQYAKGNAVITIDADLQHPPELIPTMLTLWEGGNDVVFAYRENKNHHVNYLGQVSSSLFYKLMNHLSEIELEDGIADYRLIDQKVKDVLCNLYDEHPFFRGLVKWAGFKQQAIPYVPNARVSGQTKYNRRGLLKLAFRGITSFSTKPLYIALYLGFFFAVVALLLVPYIAISYFCGYSVPGWASMMLFTAFFEGLQLCILGIIGLYLGKVFTQVKYRPNYIVRSTNFE